MVEYTLSKIKDLGLQREVMDALPYAVVGGAWKGSFPGVYDEVTLLQHIVPAGQQLKILFLRIWSQHADGAKFSIVQTNVGGEVGSVEYDSDLPPGTGVRDYPMLEAAGAEVLHGGLRDPIHVLEGSIDFKIQHTPDPATGDYFSIAWWGVEKIPEP